MIETSYDELHALIQRGIIARDYAWNHYDELAARESMYTLYGPHSVFMGAAAPCHLTPARERVLSTKNRRKKYMKYELDQYFRVVRVASIYPNDSIYCIYHVFELDGVIYGCPFEANKKRFADTRTEAYILSNGKAKYYAQTSENSIFCEFYEYPTDKSRICTGYLYSKNCQLTSYKLPPNWDAPFGAPDSPVSMHCYEDTPWILDFSKYYSE